MSDKEAAQAARIRVEGVVQGVGFRPFVHRLALRYGLAGWVRNEAGGVEIVIEGTGEVNHQWSKGWAFERDFAAYLRRHVAARCFAAEGDPAESVLEVAGGLDIDLLGGARPSRGPRAGAAGRTDA